MLNLNQPRISFKSGEPPARSTTTSHDQRVYIRVRRRLLQPILTTVTNPPTTNPPTTNPPTTGTLPGHLYLIEGTIQDISRYAGTTVDWVIKVTHLICAPSGAGTLYTHTTGTPQDWYNKDREANWRQVVLGDPLLPGIYEFETSSSIILSRLSERRTRSRTSLGSEPSATAFRTKLERRDVTCVVTSNSFSLIASHLIPKRMGTVGAKAVVTNFVGVNAALEVHRFHPMIGILLISTLDTLVDCYKLGFYHNTGDTYTLHNFDTAHQNITCYGVEVPDSLGLPLLHSHQVTLSVQAGDDPLPPKGVFDWHYLQCVAKQFATSEYKGFHNIYFYVYPFKTADDDSDDEFDSEDNDDIEPPYPTYHFDRFLAEQGRKQMMNERAQEVALWSAGVTSSEVQ